MDRITFVKYNSMRKPEYRITTEAHESENGKWVVKRPGSNAAKAHLNRIASNRELLEKRLYKDIAVLDIATEDDRLRFPFAEGRTLADGIEFSKKDKEPFIEKTNQLMDRVLDVREECKCGFVPTEEFVSWFGDVYPEEGVPAVCPANLDSIFSNFIETEEGLVNLDYEWVYDFPIPVDFIKYRCIRYFYNERMNSLFDGISRDTVMEWFGFDQKRQDMFWSMESHFQQTIYGQNWRYLYLNRYKKGEITIQSLDDEIADQKRIIREKEEHVHNLEGRIVELNRKIESLLSSKSWRITKPLRDVGTLIRRTVDR